MLRDMMGAPDEKVRVLTGNVGGSFGMKAPSIRNMSASCTPRTRSAGR